MFWLRKPNIEGRPILMMELIMEPSV